MTQPLFFMPDPGIPDSDVLGYGDLIFSDGSQMFVDGDPEVASMYPRADQAQPIDFGANDVRMGTSEPASSLMPIEGSDAMVDISTGELQAGDPLAGVPQPSFDDELPGAGNGTIGSGSGTLVPVGDSGAMVDISTGEFQPPPTVGAQPGAPAAGYGTGGLQLAQREGALPPAVAQQQALEMEQQNQQLYAAAETQRAQELQIYQQAALQRQGQLDAERAELQRQQQEQQAKMQRLQSEQKELAEMDIKTDLVTANGAVGAVFSLLGAAMLGAVGSDAGLRMIDAAIDQSVKKQVNQRDTKLRLYADRIESTQQAIAAGKAELYKVLAEKAETTQKLTQASVFETQTPQILEALKAGQLKNEQEFERLSLGKTTEVAPKPAAGGMTATQRAGQVQKYGEAAASQENVQADVLRAAQQLGLKGWDAGKGQFQNRQQVLDEGISGVGGMDTFMRQLGKMPIVGALPQALDTAATSNRGLGNRAAVESLVAAEAIRQNPGRAPTEGDIERARESLGSLTESGLVQAVERLLAYQPTVQQQNRATFGDQAAAEYQQRRGATPSPGGAQYEPLEPGKAREQLQQYRQQGTERRGTTTVDGQPQGQLDATPEQRMAEVADYVTGIAGRELPPEGVDILVAQAAHETGDGQSAPGSNFFGHKSSGRSRAAGRGSAELMTTEGEGAGAHRTRQSFAQYASPGESVADHVDLLKRKYPLAWEALQAGDPAAYVAALKDGGYFTGNETVYLNGILGRLQTAQTAYEQDLDPNFDPSLGG